MLKVEEGENLTILYIFNEAKIEGARNYQEGYVSNYMKRGYLFKEIRTLNLYNFI